MNKSESIVNLSKALLVAQKAMGGATKGANNPYFKSKYSDFNSVLEAVKDPFNDAGIVLLQPSVNIDGRNYIETILLHSASGEFISGLTEIICSKPNDPQAFGAAMTYASRFGLQKFSVTPSEDDDGNIASGKTATKQYDNTKQQSVAITAVDKAVAPTVSIVAQEPKAPPQTVSSFNQDKKTSTPLAEKKPAATSAAAIAGTASKGGW